MPLKNDRYTYRVTWSDDDQEYVGLCSEFHSLSWLDKEPESALKGIREIVNSVIKDMTLTGEEAPQSIASKQPCPKRAQRSMKIPPYPPLVKGGWGDFHTKDIAVNLWFASLPKFTETSPFRHLKQESV